MSYPRDENNGWNSGLPTPPPSNNFASVNNPNQHLVYPNQEEHYVNAANHQSGQSTSPTTGSYTMLPVGHGNYLKVYHNSERDEYYDLFQSKTLIQQNPIQMAPQPQSDMVNQNFRQTNDGMSSTTNLLLNQLVGNLGSQNISGTYSPFGDTMLNMNEKSIASHVRLAPVDNTCIDSSSLPPHCIDNSAYQSSGMLSSRSPMDSLLADNRLKTKPVDPVKKQRIVAEVKPMRMSYSDVLSQNVSLKENNNEANASTINASTPNSGTPMRSAKNTNDKKQAFNNPVGNFDKKPSDSDISKESSSKVGGSSNNFKKASGGNLPTKFNSDSLNSSGPSGERDKKLCNDFDSGKENIITAKVSAKQKKLKNSIAGAQKRSGNFKSNDSFSYSNNFEIKKRLNVDGDDDFNDDDEDDEDDDMDEEEKESSFKTINQPGFYNIAKSINDTQSAERNQGNRNQKRGKTSSLSLSSSSVAGRSSNKFDKSNRRTQKSRRNRKYILLKNFVDKWWEYTVKFFTWLLSLVSDVIVLSFSIVWDHMKTGVKYLYNVFITCRSEVKNNSGFSLNWIKRLGKRIDQKFSKDSKFAFWRKLRSKKEVIEPVSDFYKNGRLPQTGDEAMHSLLNCKGKDAYSILGVSADCSQEQIRKHYKKIAVLVHPDKNKQPGAEEAFKILQRAFELIGEPENRKAYDLSVAEALNAEKAWTELNDLLTQLHTKIAEAANTIRCSSCGLRHPRKLTGRQHFAARECSSCKIRHSAREGDIWAETTLLGLRWKYLALMEGTVYDITEWASCQKGALSHLKPNTHMVQYRIVLGGQDQQHSDKEKNKRNNPTSSEPNLDDFLNNLYGGSNQTNTNPSRRRSKKN